MTTDITIGAFSRMTHLTVKTLRHYHRVGLLEPSDIDPRSGYRYYSTDQVPTAQMIRRFRSLDMPLDEVRAVLAAPDRAARDQLIAAHLDRLQSQLEHTQAAVESLRTLLDPSRDGALIEHRSVPPVEALTISAVVGHDGIAEWWASGLAELRATASAQGLAATAPAGGLYANEVFEGETGPRHALPPGGRRPAGRPPDGGTDPGRGGSRCRARRPGPHGARGRHRPHLRRPRGLRGRARTGGQRSDP